jgi:hypothetical protein
MVLAASLLSVGLAQLACATPAVSRSAALEESVAATASAQVLSGEDSDDTLRTAQAEATRGAMGAAATQMAKLGLSQAANAATAAAVEPVLAELRLYGIDPSEGHTAWVHPPFDLDVNGYMQTDSANEFGSTVAADFVLSADIAWNTQYGTSGCGFALRSDGNRDKPNQYMLLASRGGSGHITFMTLANGQLASSRDFFPRTNDPSFDAQNGGVNRIAVVARGVKFTIYTNGVKIGEVTGGEAPTRPVLPTVPNLPVAPGLPALATQAKQTANAHEEELDQAEANFEGQRRAFEQNNTRFEKGFIAMLAMSESGETHCRFENTWLFLLGEALFAPPAAPVK